MEGGKERRGEERRGGGRWGTKVLLTPSNATLKRRTKPCDLSGQARRAPFCNINSSAAFVPQTS